MYPVHRVVCLCHNQNYARGLCQVLQAMLIPVKYNMYVNYTATVTIPPSANITAYIWLFKHFPVGFLS